MNLPTGPLAGRTRMFAGAATMRTGNGLRVALQACLLLMLGLSGCAAPPPGSSLPWCASPKLLVDAVFAGGALYRCDVHSGGRVRIEIRPEDEPPINPSPWYAFRLSPRGATSATVELVATAGYARYWPKLSIDGESFEPLAAATVEIPGKGRTMRFTVPLGELPVTIAAQELLLPDAYAAWMRELAARPHVTPSALGHSVQGRPIQAAMTARRPEAVLLLGRQHPPEVSGAIAMRPFVDTVLGDSALAAAFRERYMVIVVPLINPDGVVRGHWRHNVNGVDLNRDWGPFTQPETQSVAELLEELEAAGTRPRLMLDFHSTRSSLFYTQMAVDLEPDFATAWLGRARARAPDYEFRHEPREVSDQPNTKNYFFRRYRIPAITYEVGDEADREILRRTTPVFAEEMMQVMLER